MSINSLNSNVNSPGPGALERRFLALTQRARRLPWGVAVLNLTAGLALLTFVATLPGCNSAADTVAQDVRPVKAATVKFDMPGLSARYPGTVEPRHASDIAFQVGGRVARRLVDIGSTVAPGTPLALLDDEDLRLALRSAEAQVSAARADAVQAGMDMDRYEQIKNSPAFSQSVYDKRLSMLKMADARLREAESHLKLKQNQLAYATVTADQLGIVTAVNVEAGQVVAPGQTVFTIAGVNDLEIQVNIPERRLADLKIGQATVGLWSRPGERFAATLREVAASADPITRTYAVRYVVDDMPGDLQIGMSATVALDTPGTVRVAEVPLSAVFQDRDVPTVWVVAADGTTLIRTPVTVSAFRTTSALVSGGIKDGDLIVTAGVHRLDENQRVRVLPAVSATSGI